MRRRERHRGDHLERHGGAQRLERQGIALLADGKLGCPEHRLVHVRGWLLAKARGPALEQLQLLLGHGFRNARRDLHAPPGPPRRNVEADSR